MNQRTLAKCKSDIKALQTNGSIKHAKDSIKFILENPTYSNLTRKEIKNIVGTSRQNVEKYYNMFKSQNGMDTTRGLTSKDCSTMKGIIVENQLKHTPLTRVETMVAMANVIRSRNPNYNHEMVSTGLYYQLLESDEDLRLLKGSVRTNARTNVDSTQVKDFPVEQQKFLIDNKVPLDRIWNMDETGISLDETGRKFVVSKKHGKPTIKKLNYPHHITMVGCISASGDHLTPYTIVKAPKSSIGDVVIKTKGMFTFNESGWVSTSEKQAFIEFFGKWINNGLTPPYPLTVLYCDNHSSNIQESVVEVLNKYNIYCHTFPANSTHLLQPLDLNIFGHFKKHLATGLNSLKTFNILENEINESVLSYTKMEKIIAGAWQKSTEPIKVENAWKLLAIDWKKVDAASKEQQKSSLELQTVENQIVLHSKPKNDLSIAENRIVGFCINSLPQMNELKFSEPKKKRGRKTKVTINNNTQVLNITNYNIQNNGNMEIKVNKNGQPRKKYTKKPKVDSLENSNKITEV
ncbi:hypothetical protein ACTFIZ_004971 [Dictyostelium cf. discoideum]